MYLESGGGAECKDTEGISCDYYKELGFCTQTYVWYMTNNCPKTCEFCGGKLRKDNSLKSNDKDIQSF